MKKVPMRNRKGPNESQKKNRPGVALELLVAKIQQAVDPTSVVTHDERIIDRYGIARQFDVVIRGMFAGRPILGVIECKDHNRRKNLDAVDAFAKKAENVGANLKIMVSRMGFAKNALKLAQKEFVTCLSVLSDLNATKFSIGDFWYGENRIWDPCIGVNIGWAVTPAPLTTFDLSRLKYDGKLVLLAFLRDLFVNHNDMPNGKRIIIQYRFAAPITLEVDGQNYPVSQIEFRAVSRHQLKRFWVEWQGEAFYDWNASELTIPIGNPIVGSVIPTDLGDWPDYDGPLPPDQKDGSFGLLRVSVIRTKRWNPLDDPHTPDILSIPNMSKVVLD